MMCKVCGESRYYNPVDGKCLTCGAVRGVKPKLELFLDLDGVLADWHRSCNELTEEPMSEAWWECMNEEFFKSLWWIEGAKEFYEECKEFAEIRFLTGTILTAGCPEGKSKWIEEFTGEGKWGRSKLIMCNSRDKYLIAKRRRVLVDDTARNIEQWKKAGGIGILHEIGNFDKTMKELRKLI